MFLVSSSRPYALPSRQMIRGRRCRGVLASVDDARKERPTQIGPVSLFGRFLDAGYLVEGYFVVLGVTPEG